MQPVTCERHAVCVKHVPIFADLLPEEQCRVHDLIRKTAYAPGEVIFRPGDACQDFFLVSGGRVKIAQLSAEGRVQLLRILAVGDFFGELSVFAGAEHLPYQAEALGETHLCRIRHADLTALLDATPALTRKLLSAMAARLYEAERLIEHLGLRDVQSRLAAVLLDTFRRAGKLNEGAEVDFTWRQKELAEHLATTQESISRKMGRMELQGIVRLTADRRLILLDRKRLEALADGMDSGT
ncbi:MAG: Crp/Fnr family transcriptional regulator [Patescibacteria group bacterium]